MKRTAAAGALAFALVALASPAALAAAPPTATTGTNPLEQPFAPKDGPGKSEREVVAAFVAYPKVARWLERYPAHPTTDAVFDDATRRWTVKVWSG